MPSAQGWAFGEVDRRGLAPRRIYRVNHVSRGDMFCFAFCGGRRGSFFTIPAVKGIEQIIIVILFQLVQLLGISTVAG